MTNPSRPEIYLVNKLMGYLGDGKVLLRFFPFIFRCISNIKFNIILNQSFIIHLKIIVGKKNHHGVVRLVKKMLNIWSSWYFKKFFDLLRNCNISEKINRIHSPTTMVQLFLSRFGSDHTVLCSAIYFELLKIHRGMFF